MEINPCSDAYAAGFDDLRIQVITYAYITGRARFIFDIFAGNGAVCFVGCALVGPQYVFSQLFSIRCLTFE